MLGASELTLIVLLFSLRREHAAGPYYMSYMWYSTVASTVVVVVGMLVSLATGPQDPRRLDPRLIIPLGDKFKFLPQSWRKFLNFDVGVNYVSRAGPWIGAIGRGGGGFNVTTVGVCVTLSHARYDSCHTEAYAVLVAVCIQSTHGSRVLTKHCKTVDGDTITRRS